MQTNWTSTEDSRMVKEFPTIGASKMAARLGKSIWAVRKRAKQLNLKWSKKVVWNTSKIKKLAADYYSLGGPTTSLKYGITPSMIRYLLSKANIHNPKWYWSPEEDKIIVSEYPSSPYTKILPQLPGRTITAIRSRASYLKVRRPNRSWRNS